MIVRKIQMQPAGEEFVDEKDGGVYGVYENEDVCAGEWKAIFTSLDDAYDWILD